MEPLSAILETASFERIEVLRDRERGVLAFAVIHDTTLGPAFGGIRYWRYESAVHGLEDALRLAAAMTQKCAVAGIPGGGGKTVICAEPDTDRERAFSMVGQCVADWNGRYYTGPDVGTSTDDLAVVARHTDRVAHASVGGAAEIAAATAVGVVAGIEAVAARLGFDGVRGAHVVVQGLGAVGRPVACMLRDRGARLSVAETRGDVLRAVLDELGSDGVDVVDGEAALRVEADVFAPCALGGVVRPDTVNDLGARAVAGAANNVLATPECGERLFERGLLYAPDFVINAGALIAGAWTHLDGAPPPRERVEAIGARVGSLLDDAADRRRPPEVLAAELAAGLLAEARESRSQESPR